MPNIYTPIINKYFLTYTRLCTRAIDREIDPNQYYEKHHIIPLSLGGLDDPTNIAVLTGREHFICHYLLTKFTIDEDLYKMNCAWHFMSNRGPTLQRYVPRSSYVYEIMRKAFVIAQTGRKRTWKNKCPKSIKPKIPWDGQRDGRGRANKPWTEERKLAQSERMKGRKSPWTEERKAAYKIARKEAAIAREERKKLIKLKAKEKLQLEKLEKYNQEITKLLDTMEYDIPKDTKRIILRKKDDGSYFHGLKTLIKMVNTANERAILHRASVLKGNIARAQATRETKIKNGTLYGSFATSASKLKSKIAREKNYAKKIEQFGYKCGPLTHTEYFYIKQTEKLRKRLINLRDTNSRFFTTYFIQKQISKFETKYQWKLPAGFPFDQVDDNLH